MTTLRIEKVLIVTADSRILVGTLVAADNSTNLVRSLLQLPYAPIHSNEEKPLWLTRSRTQHRSSTARSND